MTEESMGGGELAQRLVAQLRAELPAAIAAGAQTATETSLAPARLLEAWRAELAAQDVRAISARRLTTAIGALAEICEVRVELTTPAAVHLEGPAAPALNSALLLMHVYDRAYSTSAGESLVALLLLEALHAKLQEAERVPRRAH